ncbi:MAG TPA: hypothetical protein VF620_10945 [Allosphingosinicella sp.]|jgi:hypothetical protein
MATEQDIPDIQHTTRAVELVTMFQRLAQRPNRQLDDGWAEMLEVSKSSFEYYISIASVARSLAELTAEISGSHLRPTSKTLYLDAVKSLGVYIQVDQLRSLTVDHLKQETDAFRLLTLLDDVLMPNANREISVTDLSKWEEMLDKLIEDADETFQDEALRRFVTWQLSYLRWAIRNYDLLGVDGLSRAYGSVAAELARSQGMKGAQTGEARKWYQRAKKPLLALGVALAATSAAAEQADKLLDHGGSIFEAITGNDDEADGTKA